jgi:hypothetical protein
MIKRIFSLLCVCAFFFGANAQINDEKPIRPVVSAFTAEFGTSHIADTYLTPVKYSGYRFGLHYERMQAMNFSPKNWVMQLDFDINGDRDQNYAKNATMWNMNIDARWAMMRRWRPFESVPKLTLGIGPGTQLNLGALYLSRNGNNPVSAKAAWTLNASGFASYNCRIRNLPITLRYEASLPSIGAFFAPDYGELYYEIWLGNHSNLAHVAWWGNYFALDNYVSADFRLGGTTLRLGYRNEILSTKVSGIVSERITHAVCIGITTEWLSLSSKRKNSDNVISPLY